MRKINHLSILILAFIALFLISCSGFNSQMKIASSSIYDINKANEYIVQEKLVNAKRSELFIFTTYVSKGVQIEPEFLINKALNDIPGGVGIVDASYKYRTTLIPFLFMINKASISGSQILIDPNLINE
ncbi:MAG: hypothetical protein GX106_07190 [Candidatus Cloacimonetes bacterium]|jgi:hypothetical protein|nr:hypothetical protein [Candidatus Cloacimonadota bacterium]HHV37758.1 hypothetical protein [Candidatus Cloacimonadota bacterium]